MATDTELKAQKLALAAKANADRNNARLKILEAAADGADTFHTGTDGVATDDSQTEAPTQETIEADPDVETDTPVETSSETTSETTPVEATTDDSSSADTTQAVETTEENTPEEEQPTDERVVNGVRYYLTIVNGKEKWLTKNQLIEKAQKVENADQYLQNAVESARTTVRTDPSATDDTVSVEEEDDDMEKTLGSAVLGDQEAVKKIASAFSDLRKQLKEAKKAQPSVTPDVVKEIDNRLAFRGAFEWFNAEYSKELADPRLKKLIYDRDQELAQTNPEIPYKDRMKQAGDEVRSWINSQKGIQAKPSTEKLDRKKAIVNPPTASSQRQTVTQEDDGEEDVEAVIEQMAKSRHQPRAIVHRGPLNK